MKMPLKPATSAVLWVAAIAGLPGVAAAGTRYDFNPGWRLIVGDPKGAEAPALKPTRGKAVRIQLSGQPRPSDPLDLTEGTGQENIAGPPPSRTARGTLGIVAAAPYVPTQSPL